MPGRKLENKFFEQLSHLKTNELQTFNISLYYQYLLFEIIVSSVICEPVILQRQI